MKYIISDVRKDLKSRGFSHFARGVWLKPTDKQTREEWLKDRTFGIGGSDTGTLMGLNSFMCPAELFREKVSGETQSFYNRFTKWGQKSEKDILDVGQHYDFSKEVGPGTWQNAYVDNWEDGVFIREITEFPFMIVNERYPWLIGNIDGAVDVDWDQGKMGCVAEAKNTTSQACKPYVGMLNPTYLTQVLTYTIILLPILKTPTAQIYLRLDGNDLMGKLIVLNDWDSLKRDIIAESRLFHNRVLIGKSIMADKTVSLRARRKELRKIEPKADHTKRYNDFKTKEHKAQENAPKAGGNRWELKYMKEYELAKAEEKGELEGSGPEMASISSRGGMRL